MTNVICNSKWFVEHDIEEVIGWLETCVGSEDSGNWDFLSNFSDNGINYVMFFKYEADAIAFKIRFNV